MARFPYTKLNVKINQEVREIAVEGVETPIEVKQYLPVEEKLALIGRVTELAQDENNFSNPVKVDVYLTLEIIQAYTNISLTEKQKENLPKLYDALVSSGWVDKIIEVIPEKEYETLVNGVEKSIKAFYKYRNSVLGILETVSTDYSDLDLNITNLQQKLANGENLELLKNIMTNLG